MVNYVHQAVTYVFRGGTMSKPKIGDTRDGRTFGPGGWTCLGGINCPPPSESPSPAPAFVKPDYTAVMFGSQGSARVRPASS